MSPEVALRDMVRRCMMVVANGAKADIAFVALTVPEYAP